MSEIVKSLLFLFVVASAIAFAMHWAMGGARWFLLVGLVFMWLPLLFLIDAAEKRSQ